MCLFSSVVKNNLLYPDVKSGTQWLSNLSRFHLNLMVAETFCSKFYIQENEAALD